MEKVKPPDQRAISAWPAGWLISAMSAGAKQKRSATTSAAIQVETELGNVAHSDLGTMLNNVALIYRRSERPQAAEPYYRQALALYEKQLGPEQAVVAAVLNNLGVFYTSAGRLEQEEQMHQRALAIRRKTNPKAHSDIAHSKSTSRSSTIYHSRGDLTRAGELYQDSLRQWEGSKIPRKTTKSSPPITPIFCGR